MKDFYLFSKTYRTYKTYKTYRRCQRYKTFYMKTRKKAGNYML